MKYICFSLLLISLVLFSCNNDSAESETGNIDSLKKISAEDSDKTELDKKDSSFNLYKSNEFIEQYNKFQTAETDAYIDSLKKILPNIKAKKKIIWDGEAVVHIFKDSSGKVLKYKLEVAAGEASEIYEYYMKDENLILCREISDVDDIDEYGNYKKNNSDTGKLKYYSKGNLIFLFDIKNGKKLKKEFVPKLFSKENEITLSQLKQIIEQTN